MMQCREKIADVVSLVCGRQYREEVIEVLAGNDYFEYFGNLPGKLVFLLCLPWSCPSEKQIKNDHSNDHLNIRAIWCSGECEVATLVPPGCVKSVSIKLCQQNGKFIDSVDFLDQINLESNSYQVITASRMKNSLSNHGQDFEMHGQVLKFLNASWVQKLSKRLFLGNAKFDAEITDSFILGAPVTDTVKSLWALSVTLLGEHNPPLVDGEQRDLAKDPSLERFWNFVRDIDRRIENDRAKKGNTANESDQSALDLFNDSDWNENNVDPEDVIQQMADLCEVSGSNSETLEKSAKSSVTSNESLLNRIQKFGPRFLDSAQVGNDQGPNEEIESNSNHPIVDFDLIMIALMDYIREQKDVWSSKFEQQYAGKVDQKKLRLSNKSLDSLIKLVQSLSQVQIPSMMRKIADQACSMTEVHYLKKGLDIFIRDLCEAESQLLVLNSISEDPSDAEIDIVNAADDLLFCEQEVPCSKRRKLNYSSESESSLDAEGRIEENSREDLKDFIVSDSEISSNIWNPRNEPCFSKDAQELLYCSVRSLLSRYSRPEDLFDEVKQLCLKFSKRERSKSYAPALFLLKSFHDLHSRSCPGLTLKESWKFFYEHVSSVMLRKRESDISLPIGISSAPVQFTDVRLP
jgi:hypothetical protein